MNPLSPKHEENILDEAARNLSFLISVIRSGETLFDEEEDNVRQLISRLHGSKEYLAGCLNTSSRDHPLR